MSNLSCVGGHEHGARSLPTVWRDGLILFLVSFALYAATANRGVQWQDSGDYILRIVHHQLLNPLGLALTHPLHHGLGRAAVATLPLEPCFAITLVSSLAAALAVACIYGCVVTLTNNRSAAIFASASLAVANTFWHLATITEVYTLSAALLAGECWCLAGYARTGRRSCLWGMLLLNGLGVANHLSALLTTPVLVVIVIYAFHRKQTAAKHVATGAVLWLLGALPYLLLIGREWAQTGDFLATMQSSLFGKSSFSYTGRVLNVTLSTPLLVESLAFISFNFPNLFLPAAFYGMVISRRMNVPVSARRAFLAALIIHVTFALRYDVVDRHTFFLPMYVLLAILAGIGAAGVLQSARSRGRHILIAAAVGLLVLTPVIYVLGTAAARRRAVLGTFERNKPYRDDYSYLLIPWSVAERSAERMTSEAVRLAGEQGLIVVEDPMAMSALEYKVWRVGFEKLKVVGASRTEPVQHAVAQGRTVVLVPSRVGHVDIVAPVGSWSRRGDLYVLDPKADPQQTSSTANPPTAE